MSLTPTFTPTAYATFGTSATPFTGKAAVRGIFVSSATGATIAVFDGTGTSVTVVPTFSATAATWYPLGDVTCGSAINIVTAGTMSASLAFVPVT